MTIASQLTSINNSKLAIKDAIEAKGVTVGTAPFDEYADKIDLIEGGGGGPELWTRNLNWLALPTVTDTENKFVGLHLVEADSNFLALTVSTSSGQYQVNWGDGDTENVNSGVTAYHQYDFADADIADSTRAPVTFTTATDLVTRTAHGYSNGMIIRFSEITSTSGISTQINYYVVNATANTFQVSLTSGGSAIDLVTDGSGYILPYKQVIVTITPVTGGANLTAVNLNVKHNQTNLQTYSSGWLDCVVSMQGSSTTLTVGALSPAVRHNNLEQFALLKSNITSFNNLFNNCFALRSVPTLVPASSGNITCNNMFQNCHNLTHAPESLMLFSTRITSLDTTFRDCAALAVIPDYDLSAVTNLSAAWSGCSSLVNMSNITTGTALTNTSNTFFDCRSLVSVPLFNTQNVTNTSNMFSGCFALTTVPRFVMSANQLTTSMFNNCRSLKTIPRLTLSALTNANSMFAGCLSLESVSNLGLGLTLTSVTSMFSGCTALRSIGIMSFNAVSSSANLTNTFLNCTSLSKLGVRSIRFTHSIANCKLSATELNNYYTNLATISGQTLTVSGNWGIASDTISIATAKGWTVTG
jgi:hypothetical protein